MATKPTKQQQQGREKLAQALVLISDAARLDGRPSLDAPSWAILAAHVARASSVFRLDEIIARSLELRALALGLSPATAEMITLVESATHPLDMMLLSDDDFRALAASMDEELGDL
jgi:hypothetical protein